MHSKYKKGKLVSSEMTPQTVSLLHDLESSLRGNTDLLRQAMGWRELAALFQPCPEGQSGGAEESAFSGGREVRFQGSTWYYRATSPWRLYNNWLLLEDGGGGLEVRTAKNRIMNVTNLSKVGESSWPDVPPALLLHPIRNVVQPSPGFSWKLDLPY